jgi:CRP-like cAMP-binding protein
MKIGPHGMAGEIGVMFNIPQPFTIRSRTLTQVIRISHSHLLHTIRPGTADGETIFSNFVKVCSVHMLIQTIFIRVLLRLQKHEQILIMMIYTIMYILHSLNIG